jgi:hypothetical protein
MTQLYRSFKAAQRRRHVRLRLPQVVAQPCLVLCLSIAAAIIFTFGDHRPFIAFFTCCFDRRRCAWLWFHRTIIEQQQQQQQQQHWPLRTCCCHCRASFGCRRWGMEPGARCSSGMGDTTAIASGGAVTEGATALLGLWWVRCAAGATGWLLPVAGCLWLPGQLGRSQDAVSLMWA